MNATYILPLRSRNAAGVEELAGYLQSLQGVDVIVVDGSAPEIFAIVHRAVGRFATHVAPTVAGTNGKARGVLTGLALAANEKIVVADEDVRYDTDSLQRVLLMLDDADVVRPQNYFLPAPWHAVLDSARALMNRAFDGDWPGTLAFRKAALPKGYNPNVLFENFELVRTIRARGRTEVIASDCFVARRPPSVEHFVSQRVRQAYDEFARPARLVAALAVLPAVVAGWALAGFMVPIGLALLAIACAAIGWLRAGAYRYFSLLAVFAAPFWMIERAVCAWLALYERCAFGGVRYGDSILRAAASSAEELAQWAS